MKPKDRERLEELADGHETDGCTETAGAIRALLEERDKLAKVAELAKEAVGPACGYVTAKRLHRELVEVLKEAVEKVIEGLSKELGIAISACEQLKAERNQAIKERDEAYTALEKTRRLAKAAASLLGDRTKERDAAEEALREALREIKAFSDRSANCGAKHDARTARYVLGYLATAAAKAGVELP